MAGQGKVVVYATNKSIRATTAQVQGKWPGCPMDLRNPKYFDVRARVDLLGSSTSQIIAVVIAGEWPEIVAACTGQGVPVEAWEGEGQPAPRVEDKMQTHVWGKLGERVAGQLWGDAAASLARTTFKRSALLSREARVWGDSQAEVLMAAEAGSVAGAIVHPDYPEIAAFYTRIGLPVEVLRLDTEGSRSTELPKLDNPGSTGVIASFLATAVVEFKVLVGLQDAVPFLQACAASEAAGEDRREYQVVLDDRLRELQSQNPYLTISPSPVAPVPVATPVPEPIAATPTSPEFKLDEATLEQVVQALHLLPGHPKAGHWCKHVLQFPVRDVLAAIPPAFAHIAAVALLKAEDRGKRRSQLLKALHARTKGA